MKVSLKDIAQALNLSKATISWILSGQGEAKGFSEATIKRVKEYADSVNYRPNQVARSLSLGTSNTLGLIIPFIGDTFYAQLAQAVETEAACNNYALFVCSSEGDGDKEYKLIQMLKSKQVDGIIVAPTKVSRKGIDLLTKDSLPFVLVDRYYPNVPTNYVIVNNSQSCYDLVYHIGKKGAKNIALLTTDVHLYVMKQRIEGYRKALRDLNLSNDLSLEVFVDRQNYKMDIVDKLDYLFSELPNVDGFFFSTHYLALEAIRYFIERNIDYKTKFQMGCFHETTSLDILAPRMSISRMPIHEMGVESVKILLESIQDKEADYKAVVLDNELLPSGYSKDP
ncbi:LacI family DNA-binding transcriptional regulator [Parabacteroides sp.]|uniref:LacI family DNA-binding transcriptional regulator n=1 Tax=Parabacteroides sp. TaxID=1869337 RepID=UPI0030805555